MFRVSISFVWSLFSLSLIISTGEFSPRSSFFISFFFSGGFNSSFSGDHILFLGSSVLLACSPLASLSFRSAQDISGDSSVFQLIRGCDLIQIFQSFRCIIYLFNNPFQRCFLLVGPNPKVLPRILPDSSNSPELFSILFGVGRKNGSHQSDAFPRSISNHFHCWLNLFAFHSSGVSQ